MKLININSQNKSPFRFNAKTPNLCIEPNSKIGLMSATLTKKDAFTIDNNNNRFYIQMGGRGTHVDADNPDTNDPIQIMHLGLWECELEPGTYDLLGFGTSSNAQSQNPSSRSLFGHVAEEMHAQCPFRMWGWYAEYDDSSGDNTKASIKPFIKGISELDTSDASISSHTAINVKTLAGTHLNFTHKTGTQIMTFVPEYDESDPENEDENNFTFVYNAECPYPFESHNLTTSANLGHEIMFMKLPEITGKDYFCGACIGLCTKQQRDDDDINGGANSWFNHRNVLTDKAQDFLEFRYRGPLGVNVTPDGKFIFEHRQIDDDGFCQRDADDEEEFTNITYENNKEYEIYIYSNFNSQPTELIFTCKILNITDSDEETQTLNLGHKTGLREEGNENIYEYFVVGGAKLLKNDGHPLDTSEIEVFAMTENRLKQNYSDRRGSLNLMGTGPDFNTLNIGRMNAYLIPAPLEDGQKLYSHASADEDNFIVVESDLANDTGDANASWLVISDKDLDQTAGAWDMNYWLWHGQNAFITVNPSEDLKQKNNYCFHIKNLPIESISANPEEGRTDRIIHTHYEDENNDKAIVIQPHNIHMVQLKNTNKIVLSNLDVEIRTPDGVLCKSLIGTSYLTLVVDTDRMLNKMDKLINAMRMNAYSKESQNYAEQYDKINNSVKA